MKHKYGDQANVSDGFKDKTALITGAGTGIGLAAAEMFAARGTKVAIVVRKEDVGQAAVNRIRSAGGTAELIIADMDKPDEIKSMVEQTVDKFGSLDFAFNNAGSPGEAMLLEDVPYETWMQVITTNLTSVFLCMKYELAHMAKVGGGVIINNSSGSGVYPLPQLGPYSASKHGVLGLTKVAARDYARQSIRVNAVCPGLIDTPQVGRFFEGNDAGRRALEDSIPNGRMGKPEDVAHAVLWLCSPEAAYITGESMFIDGGIACR